MKLMPEKAVFNDHNESSLIEVRNLNKWFPVRRGVREFIKRGSRKFLHAVDEVSFSIQKGEILGLAGESGSGKTTLGELIVRLQKPTSGEIIYENNEISLMDKSQMRNFSRHVTMIFQNPYESFNPRITILKSVIEPLEIHQRELEEEEKIRKVIMVLERAGLRPAERYMNKYPHELSGGELQRAAIARAVILGPSLVIADEPVSMLDASTRAGILYLLKDIREKTGVSILYISHDLATVKYMSDVTAIMYLGRICEIGPSERVLGNPVHPYTQALLSTVPVPDPDVKRKRIDISGEIPQPIDIPPGCRFQTRCRLVKDICREKEPELQEVEPGHRVACAR